MTSEERNEKRLNIFNRISLAFQIGLLPFLRTFEDFGNEFEREMKKSEIGECTEEDIKWLYDTLERWNKNSSKKGGK